MSEDVEVKQANFEGWAIVEMMGHRREIGYVTTQAFGQAVLFRIDVPGLPEREFTLSRPEYASHNGNPSEWCPWGTKVKRMASPARSCLVAPGSLYSINPCSEEAARAAIERSIERPLIVLELPPDKKPLEIGIKPDDHDEEDSDDDHDEEDSD